MQSENYQTVAIIGRPNVGKSTLFNRLIGKRQAIESPIPGTTRDRLFGEVSWNGKSFNLIDVAGIEYGQKEELNQNIQEGIQIAIEQADLIVFMVDWNEKGNQTDRLIAAQLRKARKPVILAINKADNIERINQIEEFKRFGQFDIMPVSAISGKNTGDLLDLIVKKLPKAKKQAKTNEHKIGLAIVGRPNVGKSTLINTIIGQKRAVVSEIPGTTRDIINVEFRYKGQLLEIIDTAGIRRRGKAKKETIERFSLLRTQKALKKSDIVVVMIDGEEGLVSADATIIGQAIDWGKGIVIAVSKVDLWEHYEEKMAEFLSILSKKLNFAPWAPVVFISGKDALNINPLLNQIILAYSNRKKMLPEEDLDKILDYAKEQNQQIGNIVSLKQKRSSPPILKAFYKGRKMPHKTQIRYLENKIRDAYPLNGTPIFIDLISTRK